MSTDDWICGALVAGAIALLGLFIVGAVQSERDWEKFAKAQSCVVVGKATGDTFTTVGISGNGQPVIGVGSTAAKTGYKCNDGVTYWR